MKKRDQDEPLTRADCKWRLNACAGNSVSSVGGRAVHAEGATHTEVCIVKRVECVGGSKTVRLEHSE